MAEQRTPVESKGEARAAAVPGTSSSTVTASGAAGAGSGSVSIVGGELFPTSDLAAGASYSQYRSLYSETGSGALPPAPFLALENDLLFRSIQHGESEVEVHLGSDDHGMSTWNMGGMHSALTSLPPSDGLHKMKPAGFGHAGHLAHHTYVSPLDPKFDSHFEPLVTVVASPAPVGVEGPPLAPGGYLEPCYHFFSCATPRVIIDTAVSILQAAEIECRVKHEKFRVSAKHYHSGSQLLAFSVRVFATEGYAHRYAVEFQRRSGCVITFNGLYRSARIAMERLSGLVEVSETPVKRAAPVAPVLEPLPPLVESAESLGHQRDTVKSLLNMSMSSYADVKSQALSAICDLTHNCSVATTTMMLNEGAVARFGESLANEKEGEEVHRASVTAVANLSYGREDVGTALMAAKGLQSLVRLSSSDTPIIVRESARALHSLATAVGSAMDCDELRGALRSLSYSDDARARHHSQELRKTLRITAV